MYNIIPLCDGHVHSFFLAQSLSNVFFDKYILLNAEKRTKIEGIKSQLNGKKLPGEKYRFSFQL